MITSRTKKELSGRWQKQREIALKDSTGIATTGRFGLTDLHITTEGLGKNDPLTYKLATTPADSVTIPKQYKVDIRQRPECGD